MKRHSPLGLAAALAISLAGFVVGTNLSGTAQATYSGTNGPLLYTTTGMRGISLAASTLDGTAVTPSFTSTGVPILSADGTKAVWAEQGQSWSIKMSNTDGTGLVTIISGSGSPMAANPSFSPDGTKIAFNYDRDIHIVDAAAGQSASASNRIIDSSSNDIASQPQYISATTIAYIGEQPGHSCGAGYSGIYVKDLTTSGVGTLLTNTCVGGMNREYTTDFDVSPNGQFVIFRYADSNYFSVAITKVDNSGSKIQVHTATGFQDSAASRPVFSPDGTKILYIPGIGVKVANFDGTTVSGASNVSFPSGILAPSAVTWAPVEANIAGTTTTTTTLAPTTTTLAPTTTTVAPTSTGTATAVVPGVTVTDSKIYTAAAPRRVASGSAISVLTPAQVKTQTIRTQTPAVCVPTTDDIVFIDEGLCNATVLSKKTGEVLRRIRTTVIEDDVVELGVGNEVVTLAPIYFGNGSSDLSRPARTRIARLKNRISAAGTVMVIGHSGTMLGNTPENRALSRARAVATVREMRRIRATGPFFSLGVGALDPAVRSTDRADQAKNRRVVIVLIP